MRGTRDFERLGIALVDIADGAVGDIRPLRPAGAAPILQKHAIARRRIGPRIDQEIARIDGVPRAEFERLRVAAHHPERRMRPLHRRHRKLGGVGMEGFAVERERLLLAESRAQIADEFQRRRFALGIIETERAEIIRR